jgi:ParB family chromosome partitioning protein
MSDKRPGSGLGRGLAALLDEAVRQKTPEEAAAAAPASGVREVEIGRIRPNSSQPRVHFDEEAIAELAESIGERGVLQPILLRPAADGFELVAGERRWRAAQRAGLHSIPAIVRDLDDSASAEIALIENIQRADLNPIEEAEGYRQLIKRHGHTQDRLSKLVSKSRSHVANLLRLLNLPDGVKQALMRGDIDMGHARAIASVPDPDSLLPEIIGKGLSVRQTEALAQKAKTAPMHPIARAAATREQRRLDADAAALERQLGDLLGLKVKVAHDGARGTVTLHYSNLDQLDMICQRLSGEPI